MKNPAQCSRSSGEKAIWEDADSAVWSVAASSMGFFVGNATFNSEDTATKA